MNIAMSAIEIDQKDLMERMGYKKKAIPARLQRLLEEEIQQAQEICMPTYFFKPMKVDRVTEDAICFGGSYRLDTKYFAAKFSDAGMVVPLLVTIGEAIDHRISSLFEQGQGSRAYLLDRIGNTVLDQTMAQAKERIREQISELKISAQAYPAQQDLDLSSVHVLLDIFKDQNEIVTANAYHQLTPLKSLTAFYGMGQREDMGSMCDACDIHCEYYRSHRH